MNEPKLHERYHDTKADDSVSWRLICLTDYDVTFSGPGPCRGTKMVSRDEFEEQWAVIEE